LGCSIGGTILSFKIRRCSTLAMNLLILLSAWENLIFGKDLWELELTINERIKVININGGEKVIIIWFFILKLTFGFNFFFLRWSIQSGLETNFLD
jgi:hypothetical protein